MSDPAKARAISEAIEAIQCAQRGEPHPRLIDYYKRGMAERVRRAAMQRPAPASIPVSSKAGPLVMDWDDNRIGPGGAVRND